MSSPLFFSGTTDSHSLSLSLLGTTANHFEAVKQRYTRDDVLSTHDVLWHECTREELASIRLHYHEQDHVVVLLSSPFGLLLWRCDQVLRTAASYLISKVKQAGIERISSPLTEWYWCHDGRDRMEGAIRAGNLPPMVRVPYGESFAWMRTLGKLDSVCDELDTIRKFKNVLFGSSPDVSLTVGDFLQIANRANDYLSLRSDLSASVRWCTSLEHSSKLFQDSIFGPINGRHIIEAMGRIREGDMLKRMGAPATEIDAWYAKAIINPYINPYKPVYEGLRRIGLESIPARNLCASALNGPIDPACVHRSEQTVQLEDTLPWFRLNRLARAYRRSGLVPLTLLATGPVQKISEMAGLGSNAAAPFSSALENGLIGPKANWLPFLTGNATIPSETEWSLMTLLRYSELPIEEGLDAFRDKFREQAHSLRTSPGASAPISNPTIRYQDGFYFHFIPGEDGLLRQVISIWRQMVDEQLVKGLVDGRPVEEPKSYGKSVWNGYKVYRARHGGTANERTRDTFLRLFTKETLKRFTPLREVGINSLEFY